DKIIIGVGQNSGKKNLFTIEERINILKSLFKNEPRIDVMTYTGLTVHFCQQIGAKFILRGLRSGQDFEYEQSIAFANKEMVNEVDTIFLLSSPSYTNISSTIVRDIIINDGDYSKFIPDGVKLK
ncbi:MAG TPA: pantetheine-phosphate adenylyltransferase, partial [Bacteroidia bacterium]